LPYACLLSTKGAYYVVKKQAFISCLLSEGSILMLALLPLRGKQALARDRRQDKKALEASLDKKPTALI
jgi:hypothetical protein